MRFLSAEWFAQMEAATSGGAPVGPAVSVHQRVTGAPEGDVEYTLRVTGGRVTFEPGPGGADVEVVADYHTAAAISQGRLTAWQAFAAGRLRVLGSVTALVAAQDAFASLGRQTAPVSGTTDY